MTAIIVSGTVATVNAGALVYTVRRVSPWPKPPAQPQPPGSGTSRKQPPADIPAPADPEVAAIGSDPVRSTP